MVTRTRNANVVNSKDQDHVGTAAVGCPPGEDRLGFYAVFN